MFFKIKPKHILICRNDALGDSILALPCCGVIKKYYPEIKISFLGRSYTKPVINMSSNVDHFINYEELVKLSDSQLKLFFSGLNIDTAIHLRADKAIAELIKKTGIKNRIGTFHSIHNISTCNKWVNFSRSRSHLNEAQLNIKMLSAIGINEIPTLEELPLYYGLNKIPQLEERYTSLISRDKFNIIIHPMTTGNAPAWGLENYSHLLRELDQEKFHVIIGGSKEDLKKMQSFLTDNKKYYATDSGSLSLNQYIALINKTDGIIAGSTGPLHIGAALGKYVLGLYSDEKQKNSERWGPVGTHINVLECVDQNMSSIKTTSVYQILNSWLNR